MGRGSINLHGHSHGRLKPQPRQFDVGVDVWDFRPVRLTELIAKTTPRRPSRNGIGRVTASRCPGVAHAASRLGVTVPNPMPGTSSSYSAR